MTEPSWAAWRQSVDLDEYETRWTQLQAEGQAVHGEVDFITRYQPATLLDAGCGMGRVAIEAQRRGIATTGVDADADMLERARRLGPQVSWLLGDLATIDLGQNFDVVAMPGNVIPFATPESRAAVVATCASHLSPASYLIAGFSLKPGWPSIASYDDWCADAGLALVERFATWESAPFASSSDYAVSVHQLSK